MAETPGRKTSGDMGADIMEFDSDLRIINYTYR